MSFSLQLLIYLRTSMCTRILISHDMSLLVRIKFDTQSTSHNIAVGSLVKKPVNATKYVYRYMLKPNFRLSYFSQLKLVESKCFHIHVVKHKSITLVHVYITEIVKYLSYNNET